VDNGGNINVAPVEGSVFQIQNGSGRFQADGDAWGGESRDAIYLQYEYLDASDIRHEVRDTLVFRDRGITFETIDYELVD
ncbi:MAG: DUF5627 domain-containing protein, partial [Bacteroidia bacterium]|nr:DUF5627 domain-containing protein [Bacteroidia bacterium]